MSANVHPFLRFEILKFQIHSNKQIVDLNKFKTEIEIKDKNQSSQPCMYHCFLFQIKSLLIDHIFSPNKKARL